MYVHVAGTTGSVLIREVSLFQRSLIERFHCIVRVSGMMYFDVSLLHLFSRHKMSPLLYACRGGHLGLAELLISVNADINKQDSRGWTVSHVIGNWGEGGAGIFT